MELKPRFHCPSCGGAVFSAASQPQTYDELEGLSCRVCGRPFSKEEFEAFIRASALELAKEAFKKARL
jgi:transcription elongation factor Elf1